MRGLNPLHGFPSDLVPGEDMGTIAAGVGNPVHGSEYRGRIAGGIMDILGSTGRAIDPI